ncbi:hypothetical protein DFH06DRAFT_1132958 [Mycena polygramma]|nr:hypothetical protein DFH06DRAFT_1132958 [Mycena polygramma]
MAIKRTHSFLVVPDLPNLTGDTLLQVFTHKSLRRADQDQEPFDNERLSLLGEKFLHILLTDELLGQRPMLTALEVMNQRDRFLWKTNLVLLVRHYGLLNRLRCHPDTLSTLYQEASSILFAYIGGAYVDQDDDGALRETVRRWMHVFLSSSRDTPTEPPLMKPKLEPDADTDHLLVSPRTVVYIATFNQKQWVVQCVVDGKVRGTGSDSSKKIAKDIAATQAGFSEE